MVRFEWVRSLYSHTGDYLSVILDGKMTIGTISCYGFSFKVKPADLMEDIRIGPDDLREIATKTQEIMEFGVIECRYCGGTPYFPKIVSVKGECRPCPNSMHRSRPRG